VTVAKSLCLVSGLHTLPLNMGCLNEVREVLLIALYVRNGQQVSGITQPKGYPTRQWNKVLISLQRWRHRD